MSKDERDYAEGMAAGVAEAEAEEGDLMTTRVITDKPAIWVSGYRAGRAKVRNARYLAAQAEAAR